MVRRSLLVLALAMAALCSVVTAAHAEGTPEPAWKLLAATGPTNLPPRQSEVQQVTVSASAGTFTLSFMHQTTGALEFGASAQEVEHALTALSTVGGAGGSVSVSGGPGGSAEQPYIVAFGGSFAETDVEQLTISGNGLGPDGYANVFTTVPGGPGTGEIAILPINGGGAATAGEITVELGPLPAGIVTAGPANGSGAGTWNCVTGTSRVKCTATEAVPQLTPIKSIKVPVEVQFPLSSSSQVTVSVNGGGAASPTTYQLPLVVSSTPAPAGLAALLTGMFDANGKIATQAGGHPYSQITAFEVNSLRQPNGRVVPSGDLKDINVDLQAGFVGNPLVTARCPQGLPIPTADEAVQPACPERDASFVIGRLFPGANGFGEGGSLSTYSNFFNDVPVVGAAAEFTTKVAVPVGTLLGSVRSEEDFGIRVTAPNTSVYRGVFYLNTIFYGEPPGAAGKAFFRNATDCAEQARQAPAQRFEASTWEEPTRFFNANEQLPPVTGCDKLKFGPEFAFQPTSTQGSSGVGATAHLHIDQSALTDPKELATPDLKQSVVLLPQGFDVNPAQANGLEACTEAQVGYQGAGALPNPTRFNNEPVTCPDGSKLGTVEATSPLLEEPLKGTIYLATQEENPFNSLIGLYLVFESKRFGVTLKLPGKVDTNETTGQVSATFDYVPQQPVEDLTLNFRGGGPRSEFATPEVCGTYTTSGTWTPWSAPESGPPAQTSDSFTVSAGCSSSAGSRPFHPSFEGGVTDPIAGAYSPLVIKVNRNDGEQELTSLDFTLPPGETGKLAGIPYCPESAISDAAVKTGRQELASPSCPSASQIGTVQTSAGVGSEPIHVGGKVYLAGPYKGAPLSAVVVTPAVAGPFDLGDVVIRSPLFVDPETAQITAKSDPIPTILRGIPLKVRSVVINTDRSGFSLNPTNCEAMSASATIGGSNGASYKPTNRFQVGSCAKLKFKPKLQLTLKGSTKHVGHPALKAVLTYPKGSYANIARAQVNLPHSEFIDQGNLNKTCTRPVLLAGNCPPSTVYGKAKAWTPLLDKPLEGLVYLVGGYGYKLPALVADLNGQIRVLLVGKVDSGPNKGIRTTFETVPDAPVERFVLEMKGGPKYSLFENSENLCKKPQRGIANFTAQNGRVLHWKPKIGNSCKRKGKNPHHGKRPSKK